MCVIPLCTRGAPDSSARGRSTAALGGTVLAISPRFDESKLASGRIEDKIDVFEDQMLGWLVTPAKMMGTSQHSGFAMLAVALAYFEPLGQFLEGKAGKSQAQFTLGMK